MATARPRPQVMRLTEAAARRIRDIMAKADKPVAGVRVGVKNGGCAGMAYTMEFAEAASPTDEVVEDKGVRILIDPKAVLFLLGTEMDFKTDKLSAQFVFNNPNQTSACGCGELVELTPATDDGPFGRSALTAAVTAGLDPDYVVELFSVFGRVSVKRMFGGAGIFADGLMIGLVSGGIIYLKTDAGGAMPFEQEGCGPFSYETKTGERKVMAYWRLPERLYDDPDELAVWARAALTVAQAGKARPKRRTPAKKRRRI